MKFVRENPELVMDAMRKRNANVNLDEFLELEKKRRELTLQVEALKSQRNAASQEIGKMKKAGENADAQMAEVRALGDKIAEDDKELKDIEARLKEILMTIPNMPAADTPVGSSDADNPVVRTWREPAKFAFEPQAHWDIGEKLNILDVERAGKVSGARFTFYRGLGSRLERSVIISFWISIPVKTAIRNFSRRSSSIKTVCREQASFLNLLKICSNWRGWIIT